MESSRTRHHFLFNTVHPSSPPSAFPQTHLWLDKQEGILRENRPARTPSRPFSRKVTPYPRQLLRFITLYKE